MTDNAVTRDMIALAEQMLSEATEPHILTEDNLADVKGDFARIAGGKFRDGRIIIEVERLVVDVLWQRVNANAGRRTATLIKDLISGQLAASEIDEDLDLVITVGQNRRSKLKHINRPDIDRLLEERRVNAETAAAAYAEMKSACEVLDSLLEEYGSVPAALEAGALQVRDDDEAAS